jgi:hypothetical protein
MGMNLRRPGFMNWLNDAVAEQAQQFFNKRLVSHMGQPIPFDDWSQTDDSYPRVGSYTTYGVFQLALQYLTEGDFEHELDEALHAFREGQPPAGTVNIDGADHLTEADAGTVLVPADFEEPLHYLRVDVMSKPQAEKALEQFAEVLKFDLTSEPESEADGDKWAYTAVARNVARILYQYFREVPNACVAFV